MGDGRSFVSYKTVASSCLSVIIRLVLSLGLHELREINGVRRKHGVMRDGVVQSKLTADLSY